MRLLVFASRNRKELLRDPLNVFFGIGFPLILLLLLTAIQKNIPAPIFAIHNLVPGVAVFGLSFISLFSGTLISKDRADSFLLRLFTSPLTAFDFLCGYTLPLIPLSIAQSAFCFLVASFLGLTLTWHIFGALLVLLPVAILFISMGLLAGTVLSEKLVGGICGALLTNLTGWLSGTWFDLSLVGGLFESVAYRLPFVHAVEATRGALMGNYSQVASHLLWVLGYSLVFFVAAVFVFRRKMKGEDGAN